MKPIRNYQDEDGIDVPGMGKVAFHQKDFDVEIVGFINKQQQIDRLQQEIDTLESNKVWYREEVSKANKDIHKIKKEIKDILWARLAK